MKNELTFNPKGQLKIIDVHAWMDGGTVTLIVEDAEAKNYEIEFTQKVNLNPLENFPFPGSLLLDKNEVGIRSELETEILTAIKNASFGAKIKENEKGLLKQMIKDCIEFVTSDDYIQIAEKVGRINKP